MLDAILDGLAFILCQVFEMFSFVHDGSLLCLAVGLFPSWMYARFIATVFPWIFVYDLLQLILLQSCNKLFISVRCKMKLNS